MTQIYDAEAAMVGKDAKKLTQSVFSKVKKERKSAE